MTLVLPADLAAPAGTVAVVAQPPPPPDDPGGQGEDFGKSSPVALVILLLFFLACAFLWRSMNKHLRRIPASFDNDEPAPGSRPGGGEAPAGEKSAPGSRNGEQPAPGAEAGGKGDERPGSAPRS